MGNVWLAEIVANGAFLSLHTDDPTVLGDPSTEMAGGSYIRQAAAFSSPSAKAIATTNGQTFVGLAPAVIKYIGLWDLQVGGHFLMAKVLATPITVTLGGNFLLAPGDFAIQL
jgi:hypothetical protein